MASGIRVTIWNEGLLEKTVEKAAELYPNGMGRQIGQYLETLPAVASVRYAELGDPDQGLSDTVLANTDVLTWWGHKAHDAVTEDTAGKVQQAVLDGMGFLPLHSGHNGKPFHRLMGTSCMLKWREWKNEGERERLWVVDPAHPIAEDVPEYFELEKAEMYGEHFDIPQPDQLVFISWFQGGEVFRSGCCWHRGLGKVFYFRPGHETLPQFHDEHVLKVIGNGVRWAAPTKPRGGVIRGNREPREEME